MTNALELRSITKNFNAGNGRSVEALKDVSFSCAKGEFVTILGPTGCGKTTLLRLIAGLEKLTDGMLTVNGEQPSDNRLETGFVFQQNALFPWRTVLRNVLFGLEVRGWKRQEAEARARECLSMVRLEGVENAYPYELSGGMQQRAAIARALAPSPSLLLLDEPFGALDEKTRKIMQGEILELWQNNKLTVLFVTHNIEEAVYLGERVLILDTEPGRIAEEIRVNLPHPRDRMSAEFIEYLLRARELFDQIVS